METLLRAYIERRLAAQSLKLEWVQSTVAAADTEIPVSFAGKPLASIRYPKNVSESDRTAVIQLAAQLGALLASCSEAAAIQLDQIVEQLHQANAHYDWTGVYVLKGDSLHLAAFRGSPSPHEIIPSASGICGAAVQENKTLNIPEVGADPRYLSCDFRTRSEIVVPIRDASGKAIGEIDVDSHRPAAFTEQDARRLEELALELAPVVVDLI
ncbi:MAG: GAF domain-containing protein [Bdellovibrionales bacterium]|nr:GAF domain-containing protein [Bdellovibrionales bacterium]